MQWVKQENLTATSAEKSEPSCQKTLLVPCCEVVAFKFGVTFSLQSHAKI